MSLGHHCQWQTHKLHETRGWKLPTSKCLLLSEWTQAHQWLDWGSNPWLFPNACVIPRVNDPIHCQMLCLHWLFSGSFARVTPSQNEFCFLEKADLIWKCLLCTRGKSPPNKVWQISDAASLTNSRKKKKKKEAGSFLLAKYILLSKPIPTPMADCYRKQTLSFPLLGLCYTYGKRATFLQCLCAHCFFIGF